MCSVKEVLLEISLNSQENNCARVSFLIKLQASTLLKKRLSHRCFPVNFSKFLRTFFSYRTPLVAASVVSCDLFLFYLAFHVSLVEFLKDIKETSPILITIGRYNSLFELKQFNRFADYIFIEILKLSRFESSAKSYSKT